jgi:hypothetical protein
MPKLHYPPSENPDTISFETNGMNTYFPFQVVFITILSLIVSMTVLGLYQRHQLYYSEFASCWIDVAG